MNEKMKKAIQRQEAIAALARKEDRDLTDAEREEFDALQRTVEECRDAINGKNTPAGGANDEAARAVADERKRITDISALCRDFGVTADQYITDGNTVDEVRAAVLAEIKRTGGPVNVRVVQDEGDKFRDAAADGLMMRMGTPPATPAPGATELRAMSLRDLAIECLTREGGNVGALIRMSPTELYDNMCRAYFSPTAAFPAILDNAIKKSIEHTYQHTPTTFQYFTSKGTLSDFKETKDHAYAIGGAGDLLLVGENGELKQDAPSAALLPSRKLDTYGRQFSMSRQAFVNDDISFLSEVPGLYSAAAKRTINKQVHTLLVKNPVIFDGTPLFSRSHKNLLTTGTGVTNEAIQKMLLVLGGQMDQFGEAIIIPPKAVVLPLGYGFTMRTVLESQTIETAGNTKAANPLYGLKIDVVEDPTINALAGAGAPAPWFMTGDPNAVKGIQVDYLNGQETPTIRRSEKAGVLGFVWDIFMDWGIAARDFRGLVKNPGIAITNPLD